VRVVIAPAAFGDRLDSAHAAAAMASGWADAAPRDEVETVAVSDGGPGFVAAVQDAVGGDLLPVTVAGPLGGAVPAAVLLTDGGRTAYVEAAEACGIHLLAAADRDPTSTTSYGAGQLVQAALDAGARRIVVGVGGTATNDAGAGLLAALGAGPRDVLGQGGLHLSATQASDLSGLAGVREHFSGVELVLAAARDVPLLGFHGTSASYAVGKGATQEQAQQLERALGNFADLATRSLVAGRPLLGAGPAGLPAAGAGGGLGFALLLLGATAVSGVQAVAAAARLPERVAAADVLVTGLESFDWLALTGGVVAEVAQLGLATGVPVILVAGQVLVGRRESMTLGLAGTYAVTERPEGLEAALADPVGALRTRTARVARTWSRS
jgi:glycerate 2-kinase